MISRICNLLKFKQPEMNEGLLWASGTTVPVGTTHGYQTGCIFTHTDGTAESALYVNEGSLTSCAFVPLLTTSNEIADLPDVGPTAYTAGAILVADGDSYEEVAISQDATLASTGALTVVSATGAFDVATNFTVDKSGSLAVGEFAGSGATGSAVVLSDTKTAAASVFGEVATDPGSAYLLRPIRGRMLVSTAGVCEAETYGIQGQLAVKSSTLGHYHAGVLGTVESNTAMTVSNVLASVAGVTGRPGGSGITIAANSVLAGVSALSNATSVTQTGKYAGLFVDTCSPGVTDAFGIGLYIPVGGATQGLRLGDFDTSAAVTNAIPFATGQDFWTDGQLDTLAVFGSSASNLGSGYSAKCGRFRHVVNAADATVEHETYGLVGQLVVKSATLGHLHAGIMGTFEGHTTGVVINGGYTVGAACITARLGGHASITATDPIAGFLAFNNASAALVSGVSAAFATSSASSSYPWVLGTYMPVGSVTQAVRIGDFETAAATAAAIPFSTAQDLWTDGQLSTFEVFGSSASDLTSAYSAKCVRARHVVNATSIAHESYGVMGQLVVKDTTLTHLHSGLIGTFEGHTSGVVVNGAYQYGVGAVTARCGGGAAITATKDLAGYTALWNGAALGSGESVALAIGDTGTVAWTHGIGVERCTNLLDLPAAGTDPVSTGGTVGTHGTSTVKIKILIGDVAHYLLASTVPTFT